MSTSETKTAFYAKAGESPLRYRRTSRATGLVVEIWDATHAKAPFEVVATAKASGVANAKFVISCNGVAAAAATWAAAYAISRAIDGQPTPGANYLGGQYRKLAKSGIIENLRNR